MSGKSLTELIPKSKNGERLSELICTIHPHGDIEHRHRELADLVCSHLCYYPLDDLRIHEEVLEQNLDGIVSSMKASETCTWPILVSLPLGEEMEQGVKAGIFTRAAIDAIRASTEVKDLAADERARIVLDGTHRTGSLRRLVDNGDYPLVKAPVLSFPYHKQKDVGLSHWCRITPVESLVKEGKDIDTLVGQGYLKKLSGTTPADIKEENEIPLATYHDECYTFSQYHKPPSEKKPTIDRDYELSKECLEVDKGEEEAITRYEGYDEAKDFIHNAEKVVVVPRKLEKLDVIHIVWRSRFFTRKTTRHVFPFRVFDLPIALELLTRKEGTLLEDLKTTVAWMGKPLHVIYIGHHLKVEEDKDRFYYEPMFKFSWEE